MICVVIKGPTFEQAHQQIKEAEKHADLVELRLDYFENLNELSLKSLRADFSLPMIFTLRSALSGGYYLQSEEKRFAEIERLLFLNPEYLDLESHVPDSFIERIKIKKKSIKIILSYHDFDETPSDFEGIYFNMEKRGVDLYKIAVKSNCSADALNLLSWSKNRFQKVIPVSMGIQGHPSRILSPVFGFPFTYASLDATQETAPGQISANILKEIYRYQNLNTCTDIYGLIGHPVDQSISVETHNHFMKRYDLNAVYIKMQVQENELATFLKLAKQLSFRGLSVTMPLKECMVPHLDAIDPYAQAIGAVNTLLIEKGKILGFNTDGIGALNALEKEESVKGKKVIILGAGGAARAIAYEASLRGANVIILNRNVQKALEVANQFQCVGKGLEYMRECYKMGYDILINCTPNSFIIGPEFILSGSTIMDIKTRPLESPFLKLAKQRNCKIIPGYHMFIEQAMEQFKIWFKDSFNFKNMSDVLNQKAMDCL